MKSSFVIKGNLCQTKDPKALDLCEACLPRTVPSLGLDEKNITAKFVAGEKII